jgi:esterase/lipase superfamily enzyme
MMPDNSIEEILMSWASGGKKIAYYYNAAGLKRSP